MSILMFISEHRSTFGGTLSTTVFGHPTKWGRGRVGRCGLLRQIHATKLVVAAAMLKSASTICQPASNDGGVEISETSVRVARPLSV